MMTRSLTSLIMTRILSTSRDETDTFNANTNPDGLIDPVDTANRDDDVAYFKVGMSDGQITVGNVSNLNFEEQAA